MLDVGANPHEQKRSLPAVLMMLAVVVFVASVCDLKTPLPDKER